MESVCLLQFTFEHLVVDTVMALSLEGDAAREGVGEEEEEEEGAAILRSLIISAVLKLENCLLVEHSLQREVEGDKFDKGDEVEIFEEKVDDLFGIFCLLMETNS